MKFKVKIDGMPNTLTYDRHSGVRGHQYLTDGNASSHAFSSHLQVGWVFNTNGHRYEILEVLS
jgi:hypothetical protein